MLLSIIIPCKDEKIDTKGLERDVSDQKISGALEVIKVIGVSPSGKARNEGVKKAKGDILIFLDCDLRLPNKMVFSNLVVPLLKDSKIGAVCGSIRIPPEASEFQKRYAREIPHAESVIVNKLTDVVVATSACCAMRKEIFLKIGQFNEQISRGEDPELSSRLQKAGYRTILAADTWGYHPQPDNICQLIKISFRDGKAVAFVDAFYPKMNIDVNPKGIIYEPEVKNRLSRVKRFLITFFRALVKGEWALVLYKIFYFCGYISEFLISKIK